MVRAATLAALVSLTVPAACWKPERPSGAREEQPVPASRPRGEARELVVARIDGRDITYGELKDRLDSLPVHVRMRYQSAERLLEFLEGYVQFQVLALAAEEEGLGAEGAVRDALKTELAEHYLRDRVDASVRSGDISEEEVVSYWRAHQDQFKRPEQWRVLHIRVRDRTLAEKLAFRARRMTEAAGAEARTAFESLVKKHSDDEAARDGDIGLYPRVASDPRRVPPVVEEAASRMTYEGEVAGPVEAEDGFHILFAAERVPAIDLTLEQARPRIVSALMEVRRARLRRALVEEVISKAGVTVNEEVFRRVAGMEGR